MSITNTKEQIISYQQLRTFIGLIGLFLPFVLVIGCYFHGDGFYSWQPSISHYYYTKMHVVFVCALCVLGGFLITYKGKKDDPWESRISNLAGYFAFGIASFPTCYEPFRHNATCSNQYLQLMVPVTEGWGNVHFVFAGLLFVCFAVFCFWFFQRPDGAYTTIDEKLKFNRRRKFYKWSGWGIIISICLIVILPFGYPNRQGILAYSTFFLESTSLWFFGSAWLMKGSLFWKRYPILRSLIQPFR